MDPRLQLPVVLTDAFVQDVWQQKRKSDQRQKAPRLSKCVMTRQHVAKEVCFSPDHRLLYVDSLINDAAAPVSISINRSTSLTFTMMEKGGLLEFLARNTVLICDWLFSLRYRSCYWCCRKTGIVLPWTCIPPPSSANFGYVTQLSARIANPISAATGCAGVLPTATITRYGAEWFGRLALRQRKYRSVLGRHLGLGRDLGLH